VIEPGDDRHRGTSGSRESQIPRTPRSPGRAAAAVDGRGGGECHRANRLLLSGDRRACLRLTRLATGRLLNAGPETITRIEGEAIAGLDKAEWNHARQLLHLRLKMLRAPTAHGRETIMRILGLIDEAEAKGIGPNPCRSDEVCAT
jgi:hypothetical protein